MFTENPFPFRLTAQVYNFGSVMVRYFYALEHLGKCLESETISEVSFFYVTLSI